MRERIQAAIAELNYAPSEVAASLTSSRTELIGMIARIPACYFSISFFCYFSRTYPG